MPAIKAVDIIRADRAVLGFELKTLSIFHDIRLSVRKRGYWVKLSICKKMLEEMSSWKTSYYYNERSSSLSLLSDDRLTGPANRERN